MSSPTFSHAFDVDWGVSGLTNLGVTVLSGDGLQTLIARRTLPESPANSGSYALTLVLQYAWQPGIIFRVDSGGGDIADFPFDIPDPPTTNPLDEVPTLPTAPIDELDIVRPGVQVVDGCPVLQRVQAFVVDEVTSPVLEMVIRDRDGRAIPLTAGSVDVSDSVSESSGVSEYGVLVRVTEVTMEVEPQEDKLFAYAGLVHDAINGVVRVRLDDRVTAQAGLYRLSWALTKDGIVRRTFNSLLSVEPSLFGIGGTPRNGPRSPGCPTIKEIRAQIMDSSGAENTLLQDVEFSDDQILQAVLKPLQYFNEVPPYVGRLFGTHDFPYRSHWIDAAIGYLHQFAAAHYRRNVLRPAAGGMQINDKDKENEYLRAAEAYLSQWREFVRMIKLQLNSLTCIGSLGSSY